jgi:hypothetical protein
MRSCVAKLWGFGRKQQRQRIKGHPGATNLQLVKAADQRAKRDDVESYVNIQTDVTRVLWDQHCFAQHMAGGRDVNFRRDVTSLLEDRQCFAQRMGVVGDVSIQMGVTRVRRDQRYIA